MEQIKHDELMVVLKEIAENLKGAEDSLAVNMHQEIINALEGIEGSLEKSSDYLEDIAKALTKIERKMD